MCLLRWKYAGSDNRLHDATEGGCLWALDGKKFAEHGVEFMKALSDGSTPTGYAETVRNAIKVEVDECCEAGSVDEALVDQMVFMVVFTHW